MGVPSELCLSSDGCEVQAPQSKETTSVRVVKEALNMAADSRWFEERKKIAWRSPIRDDD